MRYPTSSFSPLYYDWKRDLGRYLESSQAEFVCKACQIGTLEKPRAERGVNLHGRIHDRAGDLIYAEGRNLRLRGHIQCISRASVFLCDPRGERSFSVSNWERHSPQGTQRLTGKSGNAWDLSPTSSGGPTNTPVFLCDPCGGRCFRNETLTPWPTTPLSGLQGSTSPVRAAVLSCARLSALAP
jgi:hypothetical protein